MKKIIQFILLLLSISVSVQAANYDYLIVTTTKYTVAANRLKDWEASRGFKPYVMYMDNYNGWNYNSANITTEKIRAFYSNNNGMPAFLTIIGNDTDICPNKISPRVLLTNKGENSFVENNYHYRGVDEHGEKIYCIYGSVDDEWSGGIPIMTDNEFARQTSWSHDNSKSIPRGRISARTAQEAEDIIDKIIRYEWMPPTNPNYYSNALHMTLFQDINRENEVPNGKTNFQYFRKTEQLTQNVESVNGLGINVNRIYFADYMEPEKNITENYSPENYCPKYYYDGNNLPPIMRGCGSFWEKESHSIVDVVNNGVMYAMYNGGHGQVYGYSPTGKTNNQRFFNTIPDTDPNPDDATVTDLTNVNMPTFFYNFTCWTGTFVGGGRTDDVSRNYPRNCAAGHKIDRETGELLIDYTEYLNGGCMCENLLRMPGGAVGAYGFAQAGTTSFCQSDAINIMDELLSLNTNNDDTNNDKSVGKCLFTNHDDWHNLISMYFGDPSSHMFTQVPNCFHPTISKNGTTVNVNTNGVKKCIVTLNNLENPLAMKSDTLRGNATSISFTGVNYPYTITIKKHNYITYTGPDNLFIQNMTFNRARDVYGSTDIVAGKNVSSDYAQGNVTVSNAKVRFIAKHQITLKSGFSVKNNGKFTASVQHYTNPTGGVRRAIINNDVLAEEDIIDENDESEENRFAIYPNPSDGLFTISMEESDSPYTIEITDMTGRTVYTGNGNEQEVEIDLSGKAKGVYTVKVLTNKNVRCTQIMIK